MRLNRLIAAALVAVLAVGVSTAAALTHWSDSQLVAAKKASARFADVKLAEAAGYAEFTDAKKVACIADARRGGMGVHYVNGKRVGDAVLDPRRPEALVYAPQAGGRLKLVALEYIVFQKAWKKIEPPSMFGRTFDYVPKDNRYGLPPFWALHAWVWKQNPAGSLMAWNPNVSCT
jgi:hypothetical protein